MRIPSWFSLETVECPCRYFNWRRNSLIENSGIEKAAGLLFQSQEEYEKYNYYPHALLLNSRAVLSKNE
jgi:hypothetical protein